MSDLIERWPRRRALRARNIISRLNLCACGSDAHWECVLELLEIGAFERDINTPYDESKTFYRDKWTEFGAKVLDSWGLLEHGTGIGGAWLTEDGEILLAFLRDFGTEDHDLNDGTGQPEWAIVLDWDEYEDPKDSYSLWNASLNTPAGT